MRISTKNRVVLRRVAFGLLMAGCAVPAFSRTADEAQGMAERAVAHIKDVGLEKAVADFNKPDGGYVDGEIYVFCYQKDGVLLANGASPGLVGKNLIGVKDPNGVAVNAENIRVALTQGKGWVDVHWPNPVSKKVEAKSNYVIKVDDGTMCGSGYFKG
jgi:signal transduction histidine kinase